METWDAIRARRNVREFDGRPLAPADLDRILEGARRTPSSRNRQPWDLVVVTEPERLRALAQVWVGAGHVAGSAATVALVGPELEPGMQRDWLLFDSGQLMLALMVGAADLGIGSCHSAVQDQELARRLLGYPADRTCLALCSLGYPAGRPLAPLTRIDRRPFEEVVHRERW